MTRSRSRIATSTIVVATSLVLTRFGGVGASAAAPAATSDDSIHWKSEIAAGETSAKTSAKPVLIVFRCER